MKRRKPLSAESLTKGRRQIIEHYLQAGFEVSVAKSVPEALALLQEWPGIFVLLERKIPDAQH